MRKTRWKRWKIQRRTQKRQVHEDTEAEVNAILDSFEDEMSALRLRINELAVENQALKRKKASVEGTPILYAGNEKDLYPGEIKDMVLSVLSESLDNIQNRTRKKDIIQDVVDNNDYQKTGQKRAKEIKNTMKGYERMTSGIQKVLKDNGFEIVDTRNHYKVSYYGDKRYQTSLSKTPSDHRTGQNTTRNLVNMAF